MPKERYVEGVGGAEKTDATGGAPTFGDAIEAEEAAETKVPA